jgi:holo-[acyl-carrier protein] synthase
MILPITTLDRKEHQSARPQGLILYEALQDMNRKNGTDNSGATEEAGSFDINTLEGQMCEISISHDGDFATAVALVPSMR